MSQAYRSVAQIESNSRLALDPLKNPSECNPLGCAHLLTSQCITKTNETVFSITCSLNGGVVRWRLNPSAIRPFHVPSVRGELF